MCCCTSSPSLLSESADASRTRPIFCALLQRNCINGLCSGHYILCIFDEKEMRYSLRCSTYPVVVLRFGKNFTFRTGDNWAQIAAVCLYGSQLLRLKLVKFLVCKNVGMSMVYSNT